MIKWVGQTTTRRAEGSRLRGRRGRERVEGERTSKGRESLRGESVPKRDGTLEQEERTTMTTTTTITQGDAYEREAVVSSDGNRGE